MHRTHTGVDQDGGEGELGTPIGRRNGAAVGREILVVQMHAEVTVEGEFGIAQALAGFARVGVPGGGGDQNPRPLHFFGLVGMEHRHLVEGAVQGAGPLTGHQGHVGMGGQGLVDYRHTQTQRKPDTDGTNGSDRSQIATGWVGGRRGWTPGPPWQGSGPQVHHGEAVDAGIPVSIERLARTF